MGKSMSKCCCCRSIEEDNAILEKQYLENHNTVYEKIIKDWDDIYDEKIGNK